MDLHLLLDTSSQSLTEATKLSGSADLVPFPPSQGLFRAGVLVLACDRSYT